MQITTNQLTSTKLEVTVVADESFIKRVKDSVVAEMGKGVQVAGFRKGHAPANVVEKSLDQNQLQSQFLDRAISEMYATAVIEKELKPVGQPNVNVTKYVPFSALEAKIEVPVVGEIKLADYKKFKKKLAEVKVEDEEVEAVIDDLLARDAVKEKVDRKAADGDEVVIDFKGVDTKTKEAIAGADGSAYPLTIGSNTFIPGFEPELVGLAAGEEKTFDITFPKDYGAKEMQSKKVTFTVKVVEVKEVRLPKLDAEFASKVGPFKTVAELRTDIRKQLKAEKEFQAARGLEEELLTDLASKSKVEVPSELAENEAERMIAEEKQNILYRGQTWQEYLAMLGQTEEEHRKVIDEQADLRVKTGVVLGEVAQAENVKVAEDELSERVEQLKAQYGKDEKMMAELEKPENIRDIANRLLTEKTIQKLVEYATK